MLLQLQVILQMFTLVMREENKSNREPREIREPQKAIGCGKLQFILTTKHTKHTKHEIEEAATVCRNETGPSGRAAEPRRGISAVAGDK